MFLVTFINEILNIKKNIFIHWHLSQKNKNNVIKIYNLLHYIT